jgi:hypothetical protein
LFSVSVPPPFVPGERAADDPLRLLRDDEPDDFDEVVRFAEPPDFVAALRVPVLRVPVLRVPVLRVPVLRFAAVPDFAAVLRVPVLRFAAVPDFTAVLRMPVLRFAAVPDFAAALRVPVERVPVLRVPALRVPVLLLPAELRDDEAPLFDAVPLRAVVPLFAPVRAAAVVGLVVRADDAERVELPALFAAPLRDVVLFAAAVRDDVLFAGVLFVERAEVPAAFVVAVRARDVLVPPRELVLVRDVVDFDCEPVRLFELPLVLPALEDLLELDRDAPPLLAGAIAASSFRPGRNRPFCSQSPGCCQWKRSPRTRRIPLAHPIGSRKDRAG